MTEPSDGGQQIRRTQLEDEIRKLTSRLSDLCAEVSSLSQPASPSVDHVPFPATPATPTPSHALLLLSDSALPLGSFAYSHGLESYLAHHPSSKTTPSGGSTSSSLQHFLRLSLSSTASLSVPHLLAAYNAPSSALLESHTQNYDASLPCAVARRASLAQGRALLALWERSFRPALPLTSIETGLAREHDQNGAAEALDAFAASLKMVPSTSPSTEAYLLPQPHYPPLYGVVCRAMQLTAHQAATIFLLAHVRAILSAAVRASVLGPYAAQALLASPEVENGVRVAVDLNWDVDIEAASQGAPVMDLWAGRHEMLYSRIFNS
ncbi:MAG: hypothetical protein M1837_006313 [Sclerophora amabilis]|nr:MAG: hypothetical protein M1837_006313 [Sclerophora amabilis]